MDEYEILNNIKKSAWDDWQYFTNKNKEAREQWVVSQFLKAINIQYKDFEIISLEQHSKTDVQFRNANFQVKELPNPNLRRGKMYKDKYDAVKNANTLSEISLPTQIQDIPPSTNMLDLIVEKANTLSSEKRYIETKEELDLLIYVTRTHASLIQSQEINHTLFSHMGWRSVSCINEKQAAVLFSSASAPEFIKSISYKLITRPY